MFRLLRYFSITSFVSIVVTAAILGTLYREFAIRSLIETGEAGNKELTRVLANALWPTLAPYLATATTLPPERLGEHASSSGLSPALAELLRGLSVVKVKIYDRKGMTVFSTEARQIGEDKGGNGGVLAAHAGQVVSDLSHRDTFSAYEGVIEDRDLLSSYVPVRRAPRGEVEAVIEVYEDVTPLFATIERTQRTVTLGVAAVLFLLYGVLYVIVRHADKVIRRQYRERQEAEEALRQAQQTLERRVEERTADLARANAGLLAEIAERKQAERRIAHMAQTDALTGLPNRTLLTDRIGQAIANAHRRGGTMAVLFLDLDRFKNVNDSLGHAVGDLLLKAVAARLAACLRDGDTVGRLGGDEFIISLPEVADATEVAGVAARILGELARPFRVAAHELHTDCSVGVALYPADGDTPELLLRNADTAMYQAKESGRANCQFFSEQMTERVRRRLATETSLRRAIEQSEFTLHYQPLLDLADGRLRGAEALVRWPRPGQGLVSPAEFIPIAEDTGLIVALSEWVLREACSQARAWQEQHPGFRIAVNLSARQFRQKDLARTIERILADTGLPPALLELELTEGVLMQHAESTVHTLARLKEIGVRLAIDDFGTGYSSLSYLKRFPIHTLKIDRSFVRDLHTDPDDAAIVTAIIAMAHSLNLKVTAEGVETVEQATFLRSLACDLVQGYYYGRPMPAAEFASRLGSERGVPRRLLAAA
jgi:diguanylate cyclase (GGDEF)-like protein